MDVRRSINTAMWMDSWFEELEPLDKLLFIYLITNQKTNLLGIYEHTPRRMAFDTRIPEEQVKLSISKFEESGKAYVVDGYVWLVNWVKNQAWNNKMVRSLQNRFDDLRPETKELLKAKNQDEFIKLEKAIDSLSLAYPYPSSKEGKEVNIEVEEGKDEIKKKGKVGKVEGHGETNSTPTLTIPEIVLNEFSDYKKEIVLEELNKFYAYNMKKNTSFNSQDHIENAFKGWMAKVKKDPDDLESSYYPVIKSKIEAILSQVPGVSFDNQFLRHHFTKWAKNTMDVIKNDQQAVSSYSTYILTILRAMRDDVSANGRINGSMGDLTRKKIGIEDEGLSKILSEFKKNSVAQSNRIPPIFNVDQYDLQAIWSKIKEISPEAKLENWNEVLKEVGAESKLNQPINTEN